MGTTGTNDITLNIILYDHFFLFFLIYYLIGFNFLQNQCDAFVLDSQIILTQNNK